MDRRDNTKGYSLDNVLVCCFKCNNRKGSHWDSDEFTVISDVISAWRSSDDNGKNTIKMTAYEWRSSGVVVP
jgi:5-methylcytosine-specific restriction endonuclease McrA